MKSQTLSQIAKRITTVTAGVAASAMVVGLAAPSAMAQSVAIEGEFDAGFGCLEDCLEMPVGFIESVESLAWDDAENPGTPQRSRLFLDKIGTANEYTDGVESVNFGATDLGTNTTGYWLRASAPNEEQGQTEVGDFKFNFTKTIAELTVDFFDVESWRTTGVTHVNGQALGNESLISSGLGDSSLHSMTFFDVDSIILTVGTDYANNTGDGVTFRFRGLDEAIEDVPEPSTVLGLGFLAAATAFGLRKRNS
ncbi:LEVG family PEP-CTERM protein [Roseofilum casamattae]|uniref:LEVG family PEP-CTERM protein n=1 Tax=Roseofilum casamattae BLCC-M143 TaxID=3022442 RepID=A0ABT7C056_9CYAN|nr:LEVG family PEP-CTERM protein [Roseofilum casamattae]MDJ1184827.1 LEVG family PEP-CTERM protein [Roseofilum casamattae BLCC-M143]